MTHRRVLEIMRWLCATIMMLFFMYGVASVMLQIEKHIGLWSFLLTVPVFMILILFSRVQKKLEAMDERKRTP